MSFSAEAIKEFRNHWLPNMSRSARLRLIDLLSGRESMLAQCRWTDETGAVGCLATHIGWNDARTRDLGAAAGPAWLDKAGIPASLVVLEWDAAHEDAYRSWQLRSELLAMLRQDPPSGVSTRVSLQVPMDVEAPEFCGTLS